jgi:hypothetical protein
MLVVKLLGVTCFEIWTLQVTRLAFASYCVLRTLRHSPFSTMVSSIFCASKDIEIIVMFSFYGLDPAMATFVLNYSRRRTYQSSYRKCVTPESSTECVQDLSRTYFKIIETSPDADQSTLTISNQPRGNEVQMSSLKGRNIQSLGFKYAHHSTPTRSI